MLEPLARIERHFLRDLYISADELSIASTSRRLLSDGILRCLESFTDLSWVKDLLNLELFLGYLRNVQPGWVLDLLHVAIPELLLIAVMGLFRIIAYGLRWLCLVSTTYYLSTLCQQFRVDFSEPSSAVDVKLRKFWGG